MPCFHPIKGYRSSSVTANGKRKIVFDRSSGYVDLPVEVPCGQCIGCRLERSRQWAMRIVNEAQLYEDNCFITLTYDQEFLPTDRSVDVRVHQLFMKRFRKKFGANIRFYLCGEYGDENMRPHYHVVVFNFDFHDKEYFKMQNGNMLYTSNSLRKLWPYGFSTVGDVTFESAAYVARYVCKKVGGYAADYHYCWIDDITGEWHWRKPEYGAMSRGRGIGADWFDKFSSDVYPDDFVVLRGVKMKAPKFYDRKLEAIDADLLSEIKRKRKRSSRRYSANNTVERLRVREKVQEARYKLLKRTLE